MPMNSDVWKNEELSKKFLNSVRGAIPFAAEQIQVMLRILKETTPSIDRFLDLGCGDGVLGRNILVSYPHAQAVFLDFSDTMLQAARKHYGNVDARSQFIRQDFGARDWVKSVQAMAPFDAVVSGFAIHHQSDGRKRELYEEVFSLLRPGGVFLNLEHVSSSSKSIEDMFEHLFVDSLYDFHRRKDANIEREKIAQEWYRRSDKRANILAPVDVQCRWLQEIGYEDVDCYFKVFELALFGGRKPNKQELKSLRSG